MCKTFIYPGAILELNFILKNYKTENIFLVTGKKSFELCGAKTKIDRICKDFKLIHFNDFQPNPDIKDVIKGIKLFNKNKCNLIISVGGGSSIDMAKLINYYHNAGIEELSSNVDLRNTQFNPKPHISIPTTAGSGSEATHFAVMYIENIKYSIADQQLIPNYSIIDSEFHYYQTPYQKAVSGIDALAQSIESFWSNQSTEESRMYSEQALKLIWENLQIAVQKGDELAHIKLAIGSHLAGKAINIAKTTAPHAISYGLTKKFGIPHGHAVALSLPYFFIINQNINEKNCNDYRGTTHVITILDKIYNICKSDSKLFFYELVQYFKNININISPNFLNIKSNAYKQTIHNINYERASNNPVKVEKSTLLHLYKLMVNN